jgi:transcriptional regulator with XRE-family HTH domain
MDSIQFQALIRFDRRRNVRSMPTRQRPVLNTISRELARRGWSDNDLATRAGLDRSRLNRMKNGRSDPRIADAIRIAAVLELPLERVFYLNPAHRHGHDD